MFNDQSNVQQDTTPDHRVGQQISIHQADGETSTWITMNVQSRAPITVNAFTTAPITMNTYAGTAIKINVIDPPTSGQVAMLQNRQGSEVIDVDASEEVEETDNLSDHSFQHVHWTPSGYVEDNLSAVEYETAVESQPDVENDSSSEGEPWSSSSDDSDEGEDEDDNRSTTAEIGEPTESYLSAYGNPFRLAPHLRPFSRYPPLPISTAFIHSAIHGSRQGKPAFQRFVLREKSIPSIGSRPAFSWHWSDANGGIHVPDWQYVLDEFLKVNIDNIIDVQLDFTLPESAGYRVLAWAKKPSPGDDWYWFDIQGRVVQKTLGFSQNHAPLIHVSK
ncbi:uncharacterized protein B0J16DRAFT_386484 [Fusarium flagelliforme]|uniref:Uncharacterized protein n=1 Tax=Fusarium flagelliforme TaxID=2675880 RepID=A0A395MKK9_9HYPO|nr:uncharacterized protein B0J16DRAFT_386484 [Fusarium flagelliforme]KAH7183427.1 hypothetical protein B0J16DRAFT_386484 [Fusarium flagelliforme]RFN48478.1 hypothetical protein FIE12Z_7287 [Fusarium flagelliforme]